MANTTIIPAETMNLLSACSIDPEEDVFTQSCRVAMLKNQFDTQVEKCRKKMSIKYLDDNEYKKQCRANIKKEKKDGVVTTGRVLLIIGILDLVLAILLHVFPTFFPSLIIGAPMMFFGNISINKKISNMLAKYSKERKDHEDALPEAKRLYEINLQNSKLITAYLAVLCEDREAIPEPYWKYGGEMLYLYTSRRADNVKEAINLWEQIMHQERMEAEQLRQGMVIDQTNSLAFEAREYSKRAMYAAEQAAASASAAAVSASSAAFNSYLNLMR